MKVSDTPKELLVWIDKEKTLNGIIITICMAIIFISILFFVIVYPVFRFAWPLATFLLNVFLVLASGLFLLIAINGIALWWHAKQPYIILNTQGIWMERHGVISWNDIKNVQLYAPYGSPLDYIGVYLHDRKKISRQAKLSGKMELFWSQFHSYPDLTVVNITVPNEEFVAFASRYIKSSQ